MRSTPPNAFSTAYPSQIKPFKPAPYKRPTLVQPSANIHANIANFDEGKKMRMSKASI